MAQYIPKINLPLEGVEHARWLEKGQLSQDKLISELLSRVAALEKANAGSGRQTTVINNKIKESSSTVLNGLPPGGFRGYPLVRDSSPTDGSAVWSPPVGSIAPAYYVNLGPDAGSYEIVDFGGLSAAGSAALLPKVFLSTDGMGMAWPIGWGDGITRGAATFLTDEFPLQLFVTVNPTSDGQEFEVTLPLSFNGFGTTAPWFVAAVSNPTEFQASVKLHEATFLVYAGSGRAVSAEGADQTISLGPGQVRAWRADTWADWGVTQLTPFWGHYDTGTAFVQFPYDSEYWAEVVAFEHQHVFGAAGAATVAPIGGPRVHGGSTSARVGKVVASVDTAPTGSSLLVDVLLNGVSILTAPVAIAASATTGEAVPDVTNVSIPAVGDAVVCFPGDVFTAVVTQVGSSTPGSGLAVQVFFG